MSNCPRLCIPAEEFDPTIYRALGTHTNPAECFNACQCEESSGSATSSSSVQSSSSLSSLQSSSSVQSSSSSVQSSSSSSLRSSSSSSLRSSSSVQSSSSSVQSSSSSSSLRSGSSSSVQSSSSLSSLQSSSIGNLLPPFLTGGYYQGELDTYYAGLSTSTLRIYNFNNLSLDIEVQRRYHPGGGLPTKAPSGPGPWEQATTATISGRSSILTTLYMFSTSNVCCYEYRARFVAGGTVSEWTDYDASETYTGIGSLLPPRTPFNVAVISARMSTSVPGNENAGLGDTLIEVQGRYMGAANTSVPGPWRTIIPGIAVPPDGGTATGISLNSAGYQNTVQFRARIFNTHGAVSPWLNSTWPA